MESSCEFDIFNMYVTSCVVDIALHIVRKK